MNTTLRNGLLLLLTLVLIAGFGCAKKQADSLTPGGEEEELSMTGEERQAAMNISDGIIYFDYDSFSLSAEAKSTLTQKASIIKRFPQLRVIIEGHCDERGTEEYNLALGERRARAAYEYMLNLGVGVGQMEMVSFGKLHPAVSGSGEVAWSKNRRDEFKVSKPK
ncbi:MAG: peptidoglycan-associated lipoprotein Pal [Desulfovibrio sp.]|jgi:peptidoglycan-associated lipoprotein|nr:peptidoglycan-associated lipoprotein Pal [Desulfovibrio sp.]